MSTAMNRAVNDPFLIGTVVSRLTAILAEQQATLINTAFSTVVRESMDLACGVFDTQGQMIAQSQSGTPGHINAMATGVSEFLAAFPAETLANGDVLITNDPWATAGQLNDVTVCSPVFHGSRLVALFASTCHAADIGGRPLSGEAREVYEEGLQIPMMKLAANGTVNETLIKLIEANVRTPAETIGDIHAQIAANDVGARGLRRLLQDCGLDELDPIAQDVIERSEAAMRNAIEELPDGRFEATAKSDGFDQEVTVRLAVTIDDDEMELDFAGSDPESPFGINLVLNYTHAYASFAVKAAVAPEVPHNAGSFRPVHVSAPSGSILSCERPAPVASRHLIGHTLPSLVFAALAPALPGRVLASSADSVWLTLWRGRRSDGREFTQTLFQAGGMGARATKDGLSATGFPSGIGVVPTEIVEALTPLVQRRRELRCDSGGAGRARGGLGQTSEIACRSGAPWSVSALVDRTSCAAPGIDGGKPGALGRFYADTGESLPTKRSLALAAERACIAALPGGGGYGPPLEREPGDVLRDVVDGYVSIDAARNLYGVVVEYVGDAKALVRLPDDYRLDETATQRARARRCESPAGEAQSSARRGGTTQRGKESRS